MKLSEIDEVLIQYADTLSSQEVSFKLGGILTPEQVMSRTAQLLTTPDRLTAHQQDQLVTLKLRKLVARMEDLPVNARNAEVLIRGLEALGNRLDKRAATTERDLSQLYAFQGALMLDAIDTALAHMRDSLTASSTITVEQWDSAKERGLRHAQMLIAQHDASAAEDDLEPATLDSLPDGFKKGIAPPPVAAKNRIAS